MRRLRIRPRRRITLNALVGLPDNQTARPFLRLHVVALIVVALFSVLVLRLWTLQLIDHSSYAAAASANASRVVSIPAPRGPIVDRDGTELAADAGELQIVLSRMEARQHPAVIGAVAALVGQTPAQVEQALDDSQYSPYEPVPVVLDPSMSTVQYLDAHPEEFPGVSVQLISDRSYPQNPTSDADVASQVLGYVSPISAAELRAHPDGGYTEASQYGQTGLENEYESYLRGTPGKKVLSVDAAGQVVGTTSQTGPVEGDTLVTNLDLGLQEATQSALQSDITNDRHTVDTSTGKYPSATDGAAVVMNARTGAVLAMASYPTYNLSDWIGGISTANYDALDFAVHQ